ncbi:MAG TPA: type II secretion system protein GspM [Methylocella sp.]|jgi:general secretion pathway protein M|nr:type II secretion system protein GspM [Methylocella sp.]
MLQLNAIRKYFTRERLLPLLGFAAATMSLAVVTWLALAGLASDYADYAGAVDLLDRLEGRKPSIDSSGHASGIPGSPFLEGATVNIAGAELEQRVVAAVRAAGGNVLSSQIDLQAIEAKQGYVSLSASCEIAESALQQLIYDLESGMPFLFIDQLVVQVPQTNVGVGIDEGQARMRLQIDVSGQWQVRK